MTTERRIRTIQLINKVDRNPQYSQRIGTWNISSFEGERKTNGVVQEVEKFK